MSAMNLSFSASRPSSSPLPGKSPPGASHATSSCSASMNWSNSPCPNARSAPLTVPTLPSASAADGFSIPMRRLAFVATSSARSLIAICPPLCRLLRGGYPKRRYVQLVAVVVMKLTLAHALVAATTLAARRWATLAGGVIGGFPAVVGPILIALDAEHGDGFAAHGAAGALAGLLSLTAFVVTYAWVARRLAWPLTLIASWAVYAVATVALDGIALPAELALPLVLGSFAGGYALMPPTRATREPGPPPRWDLALRVVVTAAFVV